MPQLKNRLRVYIGVSLKKIYKWPTHTHKMLNITGHQQTAMRYHFTCTRMAVIKMTIISSKGEDLEKLEPSYPAGGM